MFGFQRVVIAEHERGLYLENRVLLRILEPGVHKFIDPMGKVDIQVCDISQPEFQHPQAEVFLKTADEVCEPHLRLVETNDNSVAIVSIDGCVAQVLPPSSRKIYWKGLADIEVSFQDISKNYDVPMELAAVLARPQGNGLNRAMAPYIHVSEVSDKQVGLLVMDGELVRVLRSGSHAFWKFNRSIIVELLDARVQPMEVSGQEILTRDKVSLRINLVAQYQISDAVLARMSLQSPVDWLYKELQFALRQAVSSRSLDGLLGNKDELDKDVFNAVVEKAQAYGLTVSSVGVKDVILPGDMKEILNRVVEAEKAAQANTIRRREETAATRSLLNTAKLMADNPTLLRLKELETLEKVTDKVDRLTVFGGLEGMLQDMVRINVQ